MKSMARFQFRDCTKLTSSWDYSWADCGLLGWGAAGSVARAWRGNNSYSFVGAASGTGMLRLRGIVLWTILLSSQDRVLFPSRGAIIRESFIDACWWRRFGRGFVRKRALREHRTINVSASAAPLNDPRRCSNRWRMASFLTRNSLAIHPLRINPFL